MNVGQGWLRPDGRSKKDPVPCGAGRRTVMKTILALALGLAAQSLFAQDPATEDKTTKADPTSEKASTPASTPASNRHRHRHRRPQPKRRTRSSRRRAVSRPRSAGTWCSIARRMRRSALASRPRNATTKSSCARTSLFSRPRDGTSIESGPTVEGDLARHTSLRRLVEYDELSPTAPALPDSCRLIRSRSACC